MKSMSFKRSIGILLSLCMLLSAFAFQSFASEFEGYTPISNAEDLSGIRNAPEGKYYLTADIAFTSADFAEGGVFYNDGAGWEPIGSSEENAFSGILDGNGHTISGLVVAKDVSNTYITYAGLIGFNKGTVKNLGIVDSDITVISYSMSSSPTAYVGSVVGFNREGTIENCFTNSVISARTTSQLSISYAYAGGIAGYNCDGNVVNCSNNGRVYANSTSAASLRFSLSYSMAGGIVGFNRLGNIEGCFNVGSVIAETDTDARLCAGGITSYSYGFISDCYNAGGVSAVTARSTFPAYAGGIVGYNDYASIDCCYNSAEVYADCAAQAYEGGIAGENRKGDIKNAYYINTVGAGVANGNDTAVAFAAEDIGNAEIFVGFDFENVWKMEAYPTLINAAKVSEAALRGGAINERVYGDINADSSFDSKDVNLLASYLAGGFRNFDKSLADLNADGIVNAKDLNIIKLALCGAN